MIPQRTMSIKVLSDDFGLFAVITASSTLKGSCLSAQGSQSPGIQRRINTPEL